MKVVLFGKGRWYQRYRPCFKTDEIIAIADTYCKDKFVDGIPVVRPTALAHMTFDRIFLLLSHADEVRHHLLELGIPAEKIATVRDIAMWPTSRIPEPIVYAPQGSYPARKKKHILMISNGLSLTGAPIVLFTAAGILMQAGYVVTVVSNEDGPLREQYTSSGAHVVLDEYLLLRHLEQLAAMHHADMIWINTIVFSYLLKGEKCTVPVLLWVHEARNFYLGVPVLERQDLYGVRFFCVSEWARQNLLIQMPDLRGLAEILPYGIADCGELQWSQHDNVVFAIVGTVCKRKGQCFFIEAWSKLPEKVRTHTELRIIGDAAAEPDTALRLQQYADRYQEIKLLGALPHEEVLKQYQSIDVLACPSLDDPLPVVATEAMMSGRPCLVSDRTGTASFLHAGADGWIFHCEDQEDLQARLLEIVQTRESLPEIGEKARQCYKKHFSLEAFQRAISSCVETMITEEN